MMHVQKLKFRIVSITILTLLFYLSYRYPFQINFSGTSPTYSDTPVYLQLGKFIIALFSCSVLIFFKIEKVKINTSFLLCTFAVLHSLLLVKGILFQQPELIEMSFWFFAAVIISLHCRDFSFLDYDRLIKCIFVASVLINSAQIFLFVFFGRLPALAYEGTISVRFGSFLDDPNGFAALCFLLLGWSLFLDARRHRFILAFVISFMILLSQSLTAIAFACPVWLFLGGRKFFSDSLAYPKVLLINFMAVMVGLLLFFQDVFVKFYEMKEGSVKEHTDIGLIGLFERPVESVLLGATDYQFYESGWVALFYNMGFLWTLFFFFMQIYVLVLLIRKFKMAQSTLEKRSYAAMALFAAYFTVGSFNLPFGQVFPVNFFYYFFSLSAIVGISESERESHEVSI